MRRYKISYFIGQAFKGMWRNGMMTLASIVVLLSCLVVMGCFAMLVANVDRNLDSLGNLNEIAAFVSPTPEYVSGDKVVLAPALSSEGKTFLGWSTDPDATVAESKLSIAHKNAITIAGTISAPKFIEEIPPKSMGKNPAFMSPYLEPIVSILVPAKEFNKTVATVHTISATNAAGIFLLIFGIPITQRSPKTPTKKVARSKVFIFSIYDITFSIASVPLASKPQRSFI